MNSKKMVMWMTIGLVALAQFYTMVEPAVTFASGNLGHGGG
ncbi:MAG: hypothetical protein AAGD96_08845 [Chloroflexota bacterium]